MASKSKRAQIIPQRSLTKTFLYWAITVFIIKLIIILNIKAVPFNDSWGKDFLFGGIWPGSDAENYLAGYINLLEDGIFSTNSILSYFPAGYPLVILFLSIFGQTWALTTLSVFQSVIFSFAAYYFAAQLSRTKLKKYSYLAFILIILNPTLSLYSIIVGYESLTASGYLIVFALITKDFVEKNDKKFSKYLITSSLIFGLMTFMQPRLIISGLVINLLWLIVRKGVKIGSLLLIISLAVTLFFPATLIYRNHKANGFNAISTNLGVTMNIGAGDKATGGYMEKDYGVPCNTTGNVAQKDNQTVKCVLNWYVDNPTKAMKLFYNKTLYFWSPWSGPEGNGTMARNPWLKINPIQDIIKTKDGYTAIFGWSGKLISWLWLIGGIAILLYGYLILWRQKSLERFIGSIAMIAIGSNWLISLISIGDHRFRVPIMGMSLFLQAIGIKTLFNGGKAPMVDGPSLR
jgi:hypothetical protein